jgi:hypothetical protein
MSRIEGSDRLPSLDASRNLCRVRLPSHAQFPTVCSVLRSVSTHALHVRRHARRALHVPRSVSTPVLLPHWCSAVPLALSLRCRLRLGRRSPVLGPARPPSAPRPGTRRAAPRVGARRPFGSGAARRWVLRGLARSIGVPGGCRLLGGAGGGDDTGLSALSSCARPPVALRLCLHPHSHPLRCRACRLPVPFPPLALLIRCFRRPAVAAATAARARPSQRARVRSCPVCTTYGNPPTSTPYIHHLR